jgi:hypothetical protein
MPSSSTSSASSGVALSAGGPTLVAIPCMRGERCENGEQSDEQSGRLTEVRQSARIGIVRGARSSVPTVAVATADDLVFAPARAACVVGGVRRILLPRAATATHVLAVCERACACGPWRRRRWRGRRHTRARYGARTRWMAVVVGERFRTIGPCAIGVRGAREHASGRCRTHAKGHDEPAASVLDVVAH